MGMEDQPTPPPVEDDQLKKLAVAGDAMAQIAELVVGYHRRLVDGGVSNEMADQMAKSMHDMMLNQISSAAAVATIKGAFHGRGK